MRGKKWFPLTSRILSWGWGKYCQLLPPQGFTTTTYIAKNRRKKEKTKSLGTVLKFTSIEVLPEKEEGEKRSDTVLVFPEEGEEGEKKRRRIESQGRSLILGLLGEWAMWLSPFRFLVHCTGLFCLEQAVGFESCSVNLIPIEDHGLLSIPD